MPGALVSASLAGLSCEELVQCVQRSAQAGWPLQALSPWRAPASPGSADALAGALPQLLHRLFAIATAGATGFLAIKAIRVGRHDAGQLLLVLLAASLLLGLIAAGSALPMAIVLLHNLCAACLLAITIRLV